MLRIDRWLALAALCISGCAGWYDIRDDIEDLKLGCRMHCAAKRAWRMTGKDCGDVDKKCRSDYRDGFIAGYTDVASGGAGCLPTYPPAKYRAPCYLTDRKKCCVQAWYDGYVHGVNAANEDGVHGWCNIGMQVSEPCPCPTGKDSHRICLPDDGEKPHALDYDAPLAPGAAQPQALDFDEAQPMDPAAQPLNAPPAAPRPAPGVAPGGAPQPGAAPVPGV